MIITVRTCPSCGPQTSWDWLPGSGVRRCHTCCAPIREIALTVSGWEDAVGTDPPPPPGDGTARDGGPPWVDPWDGLLCGIRFVQAPATGALVHRQVYVIDPKRPDGDLLRLHLAAQTVCLAAGPYVRPGRFDQLCGDCADGLVDALAEARIVLRALQAAGP